MSADLKFRALRLVNWKNFATVDVAVSDRLFIVGPNASGKSNLLDTFRFLRDLASTGGGLAEAVRRRGGVSAIRCLAARRNPDIEIVATLHHTATPGVIEYQLVFNQDQQRRPVVKKERVVLDGRALLERPTADDLEDPARLTQTHLEQVYANRGFRDVAELFSAIRYVHIVPQLVREPDRSAGRANDPYGGDFIEQIAKTPKGTQKARLRRVQEALRVAVPQLSEIEITRDSSGASHLRGKYDHWRPQGAWQTEEQFSDGTLRLIGLLWGALDGTGPLLLEEPELSLHPEVIRHLPQMFARLQRKSGRQLFASTHSADLLRDDGIGLDEVLLLEPGREGTDVYPASSLSDARHLLEGGLQMADVVMPFTRPTNAQQLALFPDA